ncbi:MAG: dephospho-CoA kinase [Oscillospiraceae bacterium]|jgi:dephospho-CoA kinase|nr:dephospho-CoA kinase [Oscillospiraceae bacterium]
MKVVGLTGGIASGKSNVSNVLRGLGAEIIDADAISRALTADGGRALPMIREAFGDSVFDNGSLNRRKLGGIVFADTEARRRLEGIIHPLVCSAIEERLELCRTDDELSKKLIIIDAPLLVEGGLVRFIDELWVCWASDEERARRVMRRDRLGESEAWGRIRAQSPFADKARPADVIIPTTLPKSETAKIVERLYRRCMTNWQAAAGGPNING